MPAEARTGPIGVGGRASVQRSGGGGEGGGPEPAQVRAMFDRIAGVYDVMNTLMTAGLHRRWRARAAELARVGPGSRVLDVATGTGELALELAPRVTPGGEVVASDFSQAMLARARRKALAASHGELRFEWGDALALPYGDGVFDAATVGFGARNFSDLGRGLAEMARVVRPGGRVVVLEITSPVRPPLAQFYALWFDRIVPLLGRLTGTAVSAWRWLRRTGGSAAIADAYAYLPDSVRRFPGPALLAEEMQRAGLSQIGYVLMAGGIVAIHVGTVHGDRARSGADTARGD
ncbi:MAG TPA: ubiquinone/menaquinone biosynthesis methyltransferase [Solirubrobacteraceae bacterium]|nr:ubiquinone/menaquinone biosynthesis methyltransferase [Solirubrobacteraceae bacterium]